MSNKDYVRDLRLRLVSSQNKQLETLKIEGIERFGIPLSRTALIKIAVNEFLENNKRNKDLKQVLEKYQHI